MVGDNDAGAFATYGQAGQNYGTHLLWTLLLLVPVLYVNQEMVLRLGAVTGVGHARLILERFGKFWGAFSVIDLFLLNALTLVTEFIGITLAAGYLGLPKVAVGRAGRGGHRRLGVHRLVPAVRAHRGDAVRRLAAAGPAVLHRAPGRRADGARLRRCPALPGGTGGMATVMLLIIGIVGTTVAPWQLFFQQSLRHRQADHPAVHEVREGRPVDRHRGRRGRRRGDDGPAAAAFAHSAPSGDFTDAAGLAHGLAAYAGRVAGVLFAVALLDASIIGAFAVSLSTAYAIGDVLGLKHSLHRGVQAAPRASTRSTPA